MLLVEIIFEIFENLLKLKNIIDLVLKSLSSLLLIINEKINKCVAWNILSELCKKCDIVKNFCQWNSLINAIFETGANNFSIP